MKKVEMPSRRGSTITWTIVVLVLLLLVVIGFWQRQALAGWVSSTLADSRLPFVDSVVQETPDEEIVPSALPTPRPTATPQATAPATTPNQVLPTEIALEVPFAPQAPHANWEQPYKDACEEASIVMIYRYLQGQALTPDEMDAEIKKLVAYQEQEFGDFKDTNSKETAQMAETFYEEISAEVVYDIAKEDIVTALSQKKPVLVLANGQKLNNPYYLPPGPEKHALVITGIEGDTFIVNDPGTRRGEDYEYPVQTIMDALVDYDGSSAGTGKKAMVIFEKT